MRMSHPLSDQLPGEHTRQRLPYLGFPVSAMNLFGMHIFCQSPSSARYSFYQPTEAWKAESTCQQWGSNLPPFAQESDMLLSYFKKPVSKPFLNSWNLTHNYISLKVNVTVYCYMCFNHCILL